MRFAAILLTACALRAEVLDRIAIVLGRQAVTRSAIVEQARVAAFLNGQQPDESPAGLRRVAERMIEQTLLRREMEASRFPMPGDRDADRMLERIRKERGADFDQNMKKYRLDVEAVKRNLLLQLTTLRFINLRFRPGSNVTESQIEANYRDTFVPEWEKTQPGKPVPEYEDVRDQIEQRLLNVEIDRAMDNWIRDARAQTRVQFFEEAFR